MTMFDRNVRERILAECQNSPFDIVIIGGGITGAGILRDAALRGAKALLVEKDDFASGTSSRSSKLIHGGLRYLETFDWGLIFEASRERALLLKLAPKLVRPLPFLYPVYKSHRYPLFMVGLGVWLYDVLALFRNIRRPALYGKSRTLAKEPSLRSKGLRGAALYFDAVTSDADLTLATVKSAHNHGGFAVNHVRATDFLQNGDRVIGVCLRDELSGIEYRVHSEWVVNAAGPWSDLVRKKIESNTSEKLRLTKGVHLMLLKDRLPIRHAVLLIAPSDGRVTFAIPWKDRTMLGTTDTDFTGDPNHVYAEKSDVDYLLDIANHYFPDSHLSHSDVISTFAGLRPLLNADVHSDPSHVSREHHIFSDKPGLVSIAGGKLTSYRKMAEQLLDWLIDHTPEWKAQWRPCMTDQEPLEPLYRHTETGDEIVKICEAHIDKGMAITLKDLMAWRTGMAFLEKDHGRASVFQIAELLGTKMKLSEADIQKQMEEYESLIKEAEKGMMLSHV